MFRGIQGDAYYYYSYAVSILWDKDLDLKNQFDHPLPDKPNQTATNGNYFIDSRTGKAFSFFNIGTGLLMLPFLSAGRLIDYIKGNKNRDPFSFPYQQIACYSNIILTSAALLFLFLFLKEFFPFNVALIIPPLFLFGSNWFFYNVIFSGWSHAFSLAICIIGLWTFLRAFRDEKRLYFALFGFLFGLLFDIRNFNLILFLLLLSFYFITNKRRKDEQFNCFEEKSQGKKNKEIILTGIIRSIDQTKLQFSLMAAIFFLIGAFPQFYYYYVTHGSPIISSFQAAEGAIKPFFAPEAEHFKVVYLKNLYLLPATIFNSDNGLFYFHPLYLLGLLGIIFFRTNKIDLKLASWALFISVYLYWFFDAAYFDTWFCRAAGAGFGHRRFLDLLPCFIFGAAILIEGMRGKFIYRFFLSGLVAFLLISSISLFNLFVHHFPDFYREKDNFLNFYFYLFRGRKAKIYFLIVWIVICYLLSLKRKNTSNLEIVNHIKLQKPLISILIIAILFLPSLIFKNNAEWERQRFRERQGFFLLYTLTPLVKIYGKEWSLPENMGRFLIKKDIQVILPCPARKGDTFLLKMTCSENMKREVAAMEIWTGKVLQGIQKLSAGKEVYPFPLREETDEARVLRLKINYKGRGSDVFVHEARIIFQEQSKLPFGNVDLPKEEEIVAFDEVDLEGWALDDWGINRLEIRGKALLDYKPYQNLRSIKVEEDMFLAKAEFIRGKRPDVERTFVLYPDILRSGWKAKVSRRDLPLEARNKPLLLRAVAWDKEGNSAEIGRRLILWRE